jgi:hypothetical protein
VSTYLRISHHLRSTMKNDAEDIWLQRRDDYTRLIPSDGRVLVLTFSCLKLTGLVCVHLHASTPPTPTCTHTHSAFAFLLWRNLVVLKKFYNLKPILAHFSSVTFKAQWLIYIPLSVTLIRSIFYWHSVFMWSEWVLHEVAIFSLIWSLFTTWNVFFVV